MKYLKLLLLVTSFCSLNFIQAQTSSKPANEEQMWINAGFKNASITNLSLDEFYDKIPKPKNYAPEELEWINAGYRNASIGEFNVDEFYSNSYNSNFTHTIDLILVNLRGSGWTKSIVRETVERVAEVYATIGIKISSVKYVEVDAPYGRVDITIDADHDFLLAKMLPTYRRPVIFFIKSAIEGDTGFAWTKDAADPPLADTAFITAEVNSMEYKNKREKGYSTTAHELAHLLCDCGNVTQGQFHNILSHYYNRANSTFTEEQIEVIKKSPLLRKL